MIRAVAGILVQDDRVLVAQRPADKPYAGYWEFPGGKIEQQESAEDALKRELHEELGITVITAKEWFSHQHHYPDKTVLLHIWLVTDFAGIPQEKEKQNLRWVTCEELDSLRVLEGNLAFLGKIRELF